MHLRSSFPAGCRRAVILVVRAPHDDGLVGVAVKEVHDDLLARGNGEVTKSSTRLHGCDTVSSMKLSSLPGQ